LICECGEEEARVALIVVGELNEIGEGNSTTMW